MKTTFNVDSNTRFPQLILMKGYKAKHYFDVVANYHFYLHQNNGISRVTV